MTEAPPAEAVPAIELVGLRKTFRRGGRSVEALRGVDLRVAPKQVFGFLGPNGAGKSTTIRILMGLLRASGGRAAIFGQPARPNATVHARVGALIEGAAFYPYLNGRDNLRLLAQVAGSDPGRIEPLLDQVGLSQRSGRQVGEYSTGMKQRLGLAAALLGDPELVILDEPTNGLDPAGIQEMRAFIRTLVTEQGKTVFMSSHILHEVEQICDRVAIVHHGTIIRQGPIAELLSDTLGKIKLLATPIEAARAALDDRWPAQAEGKWLQLTAPAEMAPHIVRRLVEAGVDVHQVVQDRTSLEDFFMQVTHGEGEDAPAAG